MRLKSKLKKSKSPIASERGMAMIETLPILVIFIVLLSFGLGFFGVVHTGIMNSMAARAYAFETLQNRADVSLFRDRKDSYGYLHHIAHGNRFHTVDSEKNVDRSLGEDIFATDRNIAFGREIERTPANITDHNVNIYNIAGRNRKGGVEASPAWIMVGYGICINARCGD